MPVMVVDDNETAREVISTYLGDLRLKVDSFADGESALDALSAATEAYKIVFLDWMMPGMTGLEVAEKIKHRYPGALCPKIIMVTSYGREDVIHSAQQLGLDGFLVKPVNQSMLFDAIVSTLDNSALELGSERQGTGILARDSAVSVNMLSGKTILLAEDNEINQQIAKELLENVGATVEVAGNGKVAIEKVAEHAEKLKPYDAVIMDLRMPVMDGIEATKILRQTYSNDQLPIIFMTADAMKGVQESVLSAGASDYITKPIDPDALMRTLREHLQDSFKSEDACPSAVDTIRQADSTVWLNDTKALKRLSGNATLYHSLLEKFVAQFADVENQLQAAFEANQWDALCLATHTLKGVSANIGAERLHLLAQEIEQASLSKEPATLQSKLPELSHVLKQSLQEVERWLETHVRVQPIENESNELFDDPKFDESQFDDLMSQLAEACAQGKATVAKDLAKQILSLNLPQKERSTASDIVTAVNKYRFKEATQLITQLNKR
ncbi:response regulator [Vibrio variabilis]|uniref:response regulator n=1 Tax=Vibrio variabilis TaxID=990271 RepID=UPI000DD726B8|nr:response regulator [Vibrio variabilis]